MAFPVRIKNVIAKTFFERHDFGPFDGGCVIMARALQMLWGGIIMVLLRDGIADHAMLSAHGMLVDADGPDKPSAAIRRFEKTERVRITGRRRMISTDLPDAPRDEKTSHLLAKRIQAKL